MRSEAWGSSLRFARAASMPVARDLLPCPVPFDPVSLAEGSSLANVSRSVRQRVRRQTAWKHWANSAVVALGDIYGKGVSLPAGTTTSLNQRLCMGSLVNAYKDFPSAPALNAAEAFSELCGAL